MRTGEPVDELVLKYVNNAYPDRIDNDVDLFVSIALKGNDDDLLALSPDDMPGIDEYCVAVDTAKDIAEYMIKMFKQEKINELYLIYTEMQSAINLRPKMIKILPLDRELFKEADNEKEETKEVLKFEPSVNFVFDILARKYVKGILYGGMVEAYVSEHSARMNAMDSATSNAEKMIKKLTLNYNRARQAAITQEISEIVSGAANI
jgi:F-type H+-transporting ATPase subunit gamma